MIKTIIDRYERKNHETIKIRKFLGRINSSMKRRHAIHDV